MLPVHQPQQAVVQNVLALGFDGFFIVVADEILAIKQVRRFGVVIPVTDKAVLVDVVFFQIRIGLCCIFSY